MIEAYTIGIRLALDDGVSSHIKAIRQDLTMIDRAVDTSGTRVRELIRLGRGLVVPEQPARVASHRENVAPVLGEHAIARADGQLPVASNESDHAGGGEHATVEKRAAPRVAREPEVTLAPQPITRPAVEMAPREHTRPERPAAPVKANLAPEAVGAPISYRQPTNLAELGRSISPANTSVVPTEATRPIIETTRERPAEPKAMMPATPNANPVHLAPDTTPAFGPPLTLSVGAIAPPPALLQSVTILAPKTARQSGSIASAGLLAFPPTQAATQARLPSVALAGAPVFASTTTIPAPPVSESAAKLGRAKASVSQESGHGELIIDGLAIGRWISDHLADRVVRPHSGFSGMDPRLSPAWPGVVSSG